MLVDSLWIYPIKGCKGQQVDAVDVTTEGFKGDREFVVTSEGVPMGQKSLPDLKHLSARWSGSRLTLSFREGSTFEVPNEEMADEAPLDMIGRTVGRVDMGPSVAHWLSSAFGTPLRLARAQGPEPVVLPIPAFSALKSAGQSKMVDVAPILMVNLVISGLSPYQEDELQGLVCERLKLKLITACERCAVTTFDQHLDGLEPSKEPLRTLSSYRRLPDGYAGGVIFGSYCTVEQPGPLHVGAVVSVIN
jgi:uncharacterized protein YcbX